MMLLALVLTLPSLVESQGWCPPGAGSGNGPQQDWNVSLVAGFGGMGKSALSVGLGDVNQMAYNGTDLLLTVYFTPGPMNSRVVRITAGGLVLPLYGNGLSGCTAGDGGPAASAACWFPTGIAVDSATGDVFVSGYYTHAVRRVSGATGIVRVVVGAGANLFRDGPSPLAGFNAPMRLAWDPTRGALFICDFNNRRLRVWNGSFVYTLTGNGGNTFSPAPALEAQVGAPNAVALLKGGLFLMDAANHWVRFINLSDAANFTVASFINGSTSTTVAGSASSISMNLGQAAVSASGSDAIFVGQSLADGLLMYSDSNSRRIRALNCSLGPLACNVTTLVGSGSASTTFNDGLPALSTNLYTPKSLAALPGGGGFVFFDTGHKRLRMVRGGVVTTIGGMGGGASPGQNGDPPLDVSFFTNLPSAGSTYPLVAAYPGGGAVAVADNGFNCIRVVNFTSNTVNTIGGTCLGANGFSGDGGPATAAALSSPTGIAVLPDGSVFFVDAGTHRLRGITPGGLAWTLAGNGSAASGSDSCTTLTACGLNGPWGLWGGFNGSTPLLLFTERHRVRGVVLGDLSAPPAQQQLSLRAFSLAGSSSSSAGYTGDGGPGVGALLNTPVGVAGFNALPPGLNFSGLYAAGPGFYTFILDSLNHALRCVLPTGTISTVFGTGAPTATLTGLNTPRGLTVTSDGAVFTVDGAANGRVLRLAPTGVAAVFMRSLSLCSDGGGTVPTASVQNPGSIASDPCTGSLFIFDYYGRLRVCRSPSPSSTLSPTRSPSPSGTPTVSPSPAPPLPPPTAPQLFFPGAYCGTVATLSGSVTPGSADGMGVSARFDGARGLWLLPSGKALLAADATSGTLRYINITGGGALSVTTLSAVAGVTGYADGVATATKFSAPFTVAADAAGSIAFLADKNNNRVRGVHLSNGSSFTFVGNGAVGRADGVGIGATLNQAYSLTFDTRLGILYIGDSTNYLIRSATVPGGVVRTLAGAGVAGWADGLPSVARFNRMYGLAVPADSSTVCGADCALLVADTSGHRIRAINLSTGLVWTVAGNGSASFADGQGSASAFNSPYAVAAPGAIAGGAVFVSDFFNHRVRAILPSGAVITLAGAGAGAVFPDGAGTAAVLSFPAGLALLPDGTLLMLGGHTAPSFNGIRSLLCPPSTSVSATATSTGSQTPSATPSPTVSATTAAAGSPTPSVTPTTTTTTLSSPSASVTSTSSPTPTPLLFTPSSLVATGTGSTSSSPTSMQSPDSSNTRGMTFTPSSSTTPTPTPTPSTSPSLTTRGVEAASFTPSSSFTPTLSPTPSPTAVPTAVLVVVGVSITATATSTATPSPTTSISSSSSPTPTLSSTVSSGAVTSGGSPLYPCPSPAATFTTTITGSIAGGEGVGSSSISLTPSISLTAPVTTSSSVTPTPTPTFSSVTYESGTPTPTQSGSSNTPFNSPSASTTITPTGTPSITISGTPTGSPQSASSSRTVSGLPSSTSTFSVGGVPSTTSTTSFTASPTGTPTSSITKGASSSTSSTSSLTSSPTGTPSSSLTLGASASTSSTNTLTSTPTPSLSLGVSPSPTSTTTLSGSSTQTPTASISVGLSPSSTSTSTLSASPSSSPTPSLTLGASSSTTSTCTLSSSPSQTPTPSLTMGASPSSTSTSSLSGSPTSSPTPSLSLGASSSSTSTGSLTLTASANIGSSPAAATSSSSLTGSPSPTPSTSATLGSSGSTTSSATLSASPTANPSPTLSTGASFSRSPPQSTSPARTTFLTVFSATPTPPIAPPVDLSGAGAVISSSKDVEVMAGGNGAFFIGMGSVVGLVVLLVAWKRNLVQQNSDAMGEKRSGKASTLFRQRPPSTNKRPLNGSQSKAFSLKNPLRTQRGRGSGSALK